MEGSIASLDDINLEQEWSANFHGVNYDIFLEATSAGLLVLEVEEPESGNRWTAEFTSQYIEEITQRAGSFKKFSVFVRMLTSALSRENDSVFVDLLTYSDLELLKARKMGSMSLANSSNSNSSSSSISSRSKEKRYMILTYTSEFDRVHYPLPLSPQQEPDAESLKRMIRRLRAALQEKKSGEQAKDDKNAVVLLRQENTELRHRLRQLESRFTPAGTAPASATSVSASQQNGEVMLAYNKLKRQYDAVRRELHSATLAYERLRTEHAKEIAKYKALNASGRQDASDAEVIYKLRAQCKQLRQQLETEKAEHRRTILRHQRDLSNLKHSTHHPPSSSASGLPPRPARSTTPTEAQRDRRHSSASAAASSSRRSASTQGSLSLTNSRDLTRSLTPTSSRAGRAASSNGSSKVHHAGGPSHRSRPSGNTASERRDRSRSSSPQPQISSQRPPWNAGGKYNTRYSNNHESGYMSATSQSSHESRRSRASARSESSTAGSSQRQHRRAVSSLEEEEEGDRGGSHQHKKNKRSTRKPSPTSSASRKTREVSALDIDRIDAGVAEEFARHGGKKSKKTSKKAGKRSADLSLDLLGAQEGLSNVALSDEEVEGLVPRRRAAAAIPGTSSGMGGDRPSSGVKDVWAINRSSAGLRRSRDEPDRPKDSPTTRAQRDVMDSLTMEDGLAVGGEGRGGDRAPALSRRFIEPLLQQRRGLGMEEPEAAGGEDHDEEGGDGDFEVMKMTRRERRLPSETATSSTSSQPVSSASAGPVVGGGASRQNGSVSESRGVDVQASSVTQRRSRDAPASTNTAATATTTTTTTSTTASSSTSSASTGADGRRPTAAPGTAAENGEQDISEIDKRIKALQSFLDKARSGILGDASEN